MSPGGLCQQRACLFLLQTDCYNVSDIIHTPLRAVQAVTLTRNFDIGYNEVLHHTWSYAQFHPHPIIKTHFPGIHPDILIFSSRSLIFLRRSRFQTGFLSKILYAFLAPAFGLRVRPIAFSVDVHLKVTSFLYKSLFTLYWQFLFLLFILAAAVGIKPGNFRLLD